MLIKATLFFIFVCIILKFLVYDVLVETSTETKIWLLKKITIAAMLMSVAAMLIGVVVILF